MEVIEKMIPYRQDDEFRLYPLGDIHIGSDGCAESEIRHKIERDILGRVHTLVVGMGDYCDSITKNDKRFDIGGLASWVKKDNIMRSQEDAIKELFKPIAGKILCLLTGNHEETIHLNHQENVTRNLCTDLEIPYGGYSCFIHLIFKRIDGKATHDYIIHAWHGAGAAQSPGARLMRLMSLVNEIQADVYLMGHLHAMTQHTPDRLIYRDGRIKSVKLAATMTGSWLKAYVQPLEGEELNPGYAEMKGYKPSRIGCPCIVFRPDSDQEIVIES